jgi:hypothetical protein
VAYFIHEETEDRRSEGLGPHGLSALRFGLGSCTEESSQPAHRGPGRGPASGGDQAACHWSRGPLRWGRASLVLELPMMEINLTGNLVSRERGG